MNEDYPYQKEWEKYRFWWKLYWLGMIPFLGFMISVVLTNGKSFDAIVDPHGGAWVASNVLGIFVLIFAFTSFKVQFWRCPRCDNWFNGSFFWLSIWTRKCKHCGLRKYQGSTYGPAAEKGS
jgi:hypothetical protein